MKMKVSIVVVAAVIAFGFLLLSSSEGESQAQYPLDKFYDVLKANPADVNAKTITLFGFVKEGTLKKDGIEATFIVKSDKNELNVYFTGKTLLPDTLEDGSQVTVDGTYDASRHLFVADKVMAKCASHYTPPSGANKQEI